MPYRSVSITTLTLIDTITLKHMAVLTSRYLYFATHPAPEDPEEDQECRTAPGEESIFSQEKKMDEVGDEKLPSKKDENGDETK
eukprot:1050514-Amorphochlora_amoeboformis.AAC.1